MWFLGDIISDFFFCLNKNRELKKKKVSDGTNGDGRGS